MSNVDTINGVHGSCLIQIDTIDNLQQNVLTCFFYNCAFTKLGGGTSSNKHRALENFNS